MTQWSIEDLQRRLDVALGNDTLSRSRTLRVERVARDGAALGMDVVVTDPGANVNEQRWNLSFPTMWEDISQMPLDGARIVVRSNIEEWWDTRHSGEPEGSFTARQLPDPDR